MAKTAYTKGDKMSEKEAKSFVGRYKWALIFIFVYFFTPLVPAVVPNAPYAGAADLTKLFAIEPVPPGPTEEDYAQIWRLTTKNSLSGADLTVDSGDTLVNGIEVGDPSLNAGYIEFTASPVQKGDIIQIQIVEASFYTVVQTITVPDLPALAGGQTYYTLGAVEMFGVTTTDPSLGATYGGTDIDASNWNITANVEYSGVKVTLDMSMAAMDDLAFGPAPYTEIVGDKDRMSKYIHFDANRSDIIIKDVKLEGTPLSSVWTTQTAGTDFQVIYEFAGMLINDGDVSGDGLYDFVFTITCANEVNLLAINLYDLVDAENAEMGSPGSADETVSVTTD